MTKNLSQLFKEDATTRATQDLAQRVFLQINIAAKKAEHRESIITRIFFFSSLVAFLSSITYSYKAFAASNFGSYASLIFTDAKTVLTLWRELGLSLLESLPIFGIVIVLASVVALLWSARKFTKSNTHLNLNAGTLAA